MKRIKRLFSILLVGIMVFSLAACDRSTGVSKNEDRDYKIGLIIKTASNMHFKDLAYGAQLAAEDYGVELQILNTTTEADVEGQIRMAEDLMPQCDALILTANDSSGVSSAVESAHDGGVKFVAVDTEIDNVWGDKVDEYLPTYIGVDHVTAGYDIGKAVCEKLGGTGNVVILRGVDAASSSNQRTEGIEKAIGEYPGITVVESQSANYDTETAQTKMGDILQSKRDIDAVICCNDLMAIGAINALDEQGVTVGEGGVVVAGLDGNIVGLNSIDDGKMYATLYDWTVLQGYWAVYNAIQLIEGENVAENIVAPSTIITKDNVAKYLPHTNDVSKWKLGSKIN